MSCYKTLKYIVLRFILKVHKNIFIHWIITIVFICGHWICFLYFCWNFSL